MPKRLLPFFAAAIILTACTNPADTAPQNSESSSGISVISTEQISQMGPSELLDSAAESAEQITTVLAVVTDEDSAQHAANEIQKLTPQFHSMMERFETLDEGDMKMNMALIRSTANFGQTQMRLLDEISRIGQDHPELSSILSTALDDIEF